MKELYFAANERVDGRTLDDLLNDFDAKNGKSSWEDGHKVGGR